MHFDRVIDYFVHATIIQITLLLNYPNFIFFFG